MADRASYRPVKKCVLAVILAAAFFSDVYAAEQAETERLIRRITPPLAIAEMGPEKKDEMYVDSFYEQSGILQGARTGHWNELTNRFGYTHRNIQGYFSISELERFDDRDYTANAGSYISMKDSYVHFEGGFGWRVDYIYQIQTIVEYGHKLYDTMFWQVGYNYRAYDPRDTHLVYPGLIYYFGDSYINADWGVSYIESRDTSQFGTVGGNFAITDFLRFSLGVAFGQRLYDIYELDAWREFGYILFTGLNFKVYKGISFRAGYSYSEEKPRFIKRSLNFALAVKF